MAITTNTQTNTRTTTEAQETQARRERGINSSPETELKLADMLAKAQNITPPTDSNLAYDIEIETRNGLTLNVISRPGDWTFSITLNQSIINNALAAGYTAPDITEPGGRFKAYLNYNPRGVWVNGFSPA